MFKFATIGAFDRAINIPYCKLATGTGNVYNGNGVTINRATETATLTTATTGKEDVYVMYTVPHEQYHQVNREDFHLTAGDMPLLIQLASLEGLEVEVTNDAHTFTSGPVTGIAAGDYLAYGVNGLLGEVAATTGYAYLYKVIELKGNIIRAEVIKGTPAT